MTQLSRHVLETLWEDGDFVLSRSTLAGEPTPVPVRAPASERLWQRERTTVRIGAE